MNNSKLKTIQNFIHDYIDLIDENNFEELYQKAHSHLAGSTSLLTITLLDAGIDPLLHLDYIPECYLWWSNIDHFDIPQHINSIHANALGATLIKSIIIPGNVKMIGAEAFINCNQLKTIEVQEGVHTIYDKAFARCNHIEKVKLPRSLASLGKDIFGYNESILEIEYNGTEHDWIMISKSRDLFLRSKAIIKGLDFEKKYGIS